MEACQFGNLACAAFLVDSGVNIKAKDLNVGSDTYHVFWYQ